MDEINRNLEFMACVGIMLEMNADEVRVWFPLLFHSINVVILPLLGVRAVNCKKNVLQAKLPKIRREMLQLSMKRSNLRSPRLTSHFHSL
jgi:hypothetical protein